MSFPIHHLAGDANKMSNRVKKTTPQSKAKLAERDDLLRAIFRSAVVMKSSCSSCKTRGLVCKSAPSVSSACFECVRRHEPYCDAQGVTAQQLQRIADQHSRLEDEMETAEAERAVLDAKINRLRTQKKVWFEKMKRAISRGIDTVEELEQVEREEAEALAIREASADPPPTSTTPPLLDADFVPLWDSVYPDVQLEPFLMSDFGLLAGSPSFVDDPSHLAGRGSFGGTPQASQSSGGS